MSLSDIARRLKDSEITFIGSDWHRGRRALNKYLYRGFWDRLQERFERHPVAHLAALYILCVAIFLLSVPLPRVDGQLVGSDGIYYYAYLPTVLIDHDLDFTNQYHKLLLPPPGGWANSPINGALNKYSIGVAILWAPFFLIGHVVAVALRAAGLSIALDGMGYVYQVPTLLGSLTYGFAGILLVYRSCRRFFSASASTSAAILIWLATNLIYYMIAEPSMSHACSFFATALFMELWLRSRPLPEFRQWILLGIAAGLVVLVRLPDATWLALPFIDTLLALRNSGKGSWGRQIGGFVCFGVAVLLMLVPQMVVWQILNGSPATPGYVRAQEVFHWLAPQVLKVLFSFCHGLYVWHPVLLFATAGLVVLHRRDRLLSLLLGLMFAVQIYVIGSWFAWYGGAAFGGRMLISSLPALALGLAALIDWAAEHKALPVAGVLSSALIVWNALFFAQYRFRYIPQDAAINLNEMTIGKLSMLKDMAGHILALLN